MLFLGHIHPTLARKFLVSPDQVTRNHALHVANTPVNNYYVDALDIIDRSRAESPGDAYDGSVSSNSAAEAIVYAAFHQHFATQKYTALLNLRRGYDDETIRDARDKLVVAHTALISANNQINTLESAAAGPEVPFGFSVPDAQIPALRAAAKVNAENDMVAAKRARTQALYAQQDDKNDIRLTENYRTVIAHDIERTRDDIRSRKGLRDK